MCDRQLLGRRRGISRKSIDHFDVAMGDEKIRIGASKDCDAQRFVPSETGRRFGEAAEELAAQEIHRRRVDRDAGNPALAIDSDVLDLLGHGVDHLCEMGEEGSDVAGV